jgi:hypothetical protein
MHTQHMAATAAEQAVATQAMVAVALTRVASQTKRPPRRTNQGECKAVLDEVEQSALSVQCSRNQAARMNQLFAQIAQLSSLHLTHTWEIAYNIIALSAHTTQAFLAPFAYLQSMDLLEHGNLLPLAAFDWLPCSSL